MTEIGTQFLISKQIKQPVIKESKYIIKQQPNKILNEDTIISPKTNISSTKTNISSPKINISRRKRIVKKPLKTSDNFTKKIHRKKEINNISSEKNVLKRKKIIDLLREVCEKNESWRQLSNEKQENILRRLERNSMNKIVMECKSEFINRLWCDKTFLERYSAELYRHISNLDIDSEVSNDYYIKKICSGNIDPIIATNLTNYELSPISSENERIAINKRKEQKIIEKYTDKHTCRKCGSKKIKYQETAGRSLGADEITQFKYICDVCNFYWIN